MSTEAIAHLTAHGVKPSAQRIAIMDYLLCHRTHPTVEAIYSELVEAMPTLSRTTVYNTLKLLEEHDAILELTIDKRTAHYDGDTTPHSHFQCKHCGRIIDIPLQKVDVEQTAHDFVIQETEVYYWGYCRQCLTAIKEKADNCQENNK